VTAVISLALKTRTWRGDVRTTTTQGMKMWRSSWSLYRSSFRSQN